MHKYMHQNCEKLMTGSIKQEIIKYGPLLKELTNNQINLFIEVLTNLRAFGICAYAERFIDKQGRSIKICNSEKWQELENKKSFFKDFSDYSSLEVVENFKNKIRVTTRSGDKLFHPFLKKLEGEKLNSSVIVSEFNKDYISISYFMVDQFTPQNRDIIINNLSIIESIRKELRDDLLALFMSNKINQNQKILLSKESIDLVFNEDINNKPKSHISPLLKGLTEREIEILKNLRIGTSNKYLSNKLQISISTVKFHLNNIKLKTGISSRERLIILSTKLTSSKN